MPAPPNPPNPHNREAPLGALAALVLFVLAFFVSTEPAASQMVFLLSALAILAALIFFFGPPFSSWLGAIQANTVRRAAIGIASVALIGSWVLFLAPTYSWRLSPPPARLGIWLSQPPWQSNPVDTEPALLAHGIATDVVYAMSNSSAVVRQISTRPPTDTLEAALEYSVSHDLELLISGAHPTDANGAETAYQIVFFDSRTGKPRSMISELYRSKLDAPRIFKSILTSLKDDFGYPIKIPHIPAAELYLMYHSGRSHWEKRDFDSLQQAIRLFTAVIDRDPEFTSAYVGLADTYNCLSAWRWRSPHDMYDKASKYADMALKQSPERADIYLVKAYLAQVKNWDWNTALGWYNEAMGRNRNYSHAHQWFGGGYHAKRGHLGLALAELELAVSQEPLVPIVRADLCWGQYLAGKYDDAVRTCDKVLEDNDLFLPALYYKALVVLETARELSGKARVTESDKALELLMSAADYQDNSLLLGTIGYAYGIRGSRQQARMILKNMKKVEDAGGYISRFDLAVVYMGLEDYDKALESLEEAYARVDGGTDGIGSSPIFGPLRHSERFTTLLGKMGLNYSVEPVNGEEEAGSRGDRL